jgi:simple sugar transport system permease protein
MALTYIGGEMAQTQLGLPAAAVQLFQGMLLFFLLAMDLLIQFRIRWKPRAVAAPRSAPAAQPATEAR